MLLARLTLVAVVVALPAGGALGAAPPCEGRWVIGRVAGGSTMTADDTIVLDATGAVVDPVCEAAALRVRGRRVTARWSDCRVRRRLTLRLRASADCTVLRGTLTGSGARASRFVATASRCGDGIRDAGRGERCDDGNLADDDGCDARCGGCVDPATLSSTWVAVQANVFDRACTACHGDQPTAGLDLRAPGSYTAIVDVAAATGLSYPRSDA